MCLRAGIAAANTSQLQYFDEPRSARRTRRDCYDYFYEQLVRVKNISVLPFAEDAQLLLVEYLRDDLDQPRAANWFLVTWSVMDWREWALLICACQICRQQQQHGHRG